MVRVALVYRGRALPLSWVVLKQKSTMVAFANYKHILKAAAAILPPHCPVILLADRGFDDNDLFCAARDLGWGFRIRLKKSLNIQPLSPGLDESVPGSGGFSEIRRAYQPPRGSIVALLWGQETF